MNESDRDRRIGIMRRYFQGVMDQSLAEIRACFTDEARVTIYHGDSAQRQFYAAPTSDQESIEDFYGHIWRNFVARFDNFTWVVDTATPVSSAIFRVTMTPKPLSDMAAQGELHLRNCNFFWFRGERLYDTVIYYANPELGARLGSKSAPATVPRR
jgi:hypothetical protein